MTDPADSVLPPVPRPRSFLQFVLDYNPFYLLSAMCMLFGIFALNNSLDWSPLPLRNLLIMIATLNWYEAALIGLAMVLLRHNVMRDATILLVIEAFFLVDVGFLNMEIVGERLALGLIVNTLILGLAVVKIVLLFHAARLPLADGRFAFAVLSLGVLFVIPGVFAIVARPRDTYLPPLVAYAGWWIAGLLPVAYAMLVGSFDTFRRRMDEDALGIDSIVARVLLALPMISIVAHLSLSHWVYKCAFHPADVAPLLLGAAVAVGRCDRPIGDFALRFRLQLVLPFVAVALSAIKFPPELTYAGTFGVTISPLRVALFAAMLVYLDGMWLHRSALFGVGAAMCAGALGMGHSVTTINGNSTEVAQRSVSLMERLIPKTLSEWGMVSIGAAFVLLALGAAISLMRVKRESRVG